MTTNRTLPASDVAILRTRTRYAVVGTGGRVTMFLDPVAGRFRDDAELVGLCDTSEVRRNYHRDRLAAEFGLPGVPVYGDFGRMMREQKPDVVIVCTPDYLHHDYIVRSMEAGADVICEKPLTIHAAGCRAVMEAARRTGRNVRTTFNMRWMPGPSKVKELIVRGEIGRVLHVDFEYLLNTAHGADYFRRWHSRKEFSGGLLIHKATHHFDLISWWIDAIPSRVFAMGGLVFYGKANALARGDEALTRYARYTNCPEAGDDPFALRLDEDPTMRALYLEAESESGYIRDRNVFREGIDIEDSMSVVARYRTGTMLSYSLTAFSPREGYRVAFSGDRGRIEYTEEHPSHIITGGRDAGPASEECARRLVLQKMFTEPLVIEVPPAAGGHGGGDPLLQEQMFGRNPPPDDLGRSAGVEQGVASVLVGSAANESIATGQPVEIDSLLPLKPTAKRLSDLV
jgi:predicted dehydrogenase